MCGRVCVGCDVTEPGEVLYGDVHPGGVHAGGECSSLGADQGGIVAELSRKVPDRIVGSSGCRALDGVSYGSEVKVDSRLVELPTPLSGGCLEVLVAEFPLLKCSWDRAESRPLEDLDVAALLVRCNNDLLGVCGLGQRAADLVRHLLGCADAGL